MKSIIVTLLLATLLSSAQVEAETKQFTAGFDHVGLTVTDLDASTDFFTDTLGWELRGRDNSYPATFVSDGEMMIALWQTRDAKTAVAFDRKNNVGLHHLAIVVTSLEALNELHDRFKRRSDITIEFAPEPAHGGPAQHMIIREPSGNRLEFRYTP